MFVFYYIPFLSTPLDQISCDIKMDQFEAIALSFMILYDLVVKYVVQIPLVYGFYETTHKWENLSCTGTYIVAMLQGKITCHIYEQWLTKNYSNMYI